MATLSDALHALIPPTQRQTAAEVTEALDLGSGDRAGKRSGFLIMLTLAGVIAIAGVLTDSTATVIGAMIIAPLGTPILAIGLGIVTGHLSLVVRSILWVLLGLVIVVVLGLAFSVFVSTPESLETNSQVLGRTSPSFMDLVAALATGFAGGFAMCRRDLSAILPGVAIAISLVPPLGVVGVCAGQGLWGDALGALWLFLSNVVALVIAGSIVFTIAGYARDPGSSPVANRRRAYVIVTLLAVVIAIPLAVNSIISVALARWSVSIQDITADWLDDDDGARVLGVEWSGAVATVNVLTDDGTTPDVDDLRESLATAIPSFVGVFVDVGQGVEVRVQ
ncbi:TIGR00341 family protein [Microbacterium sp. M3]|uniref:TIGR00341 family protein n=1 Tax=Microbacterium arthrosphaerae TaxID=792652 RepID=A0ABU4GWB1_9MICO|nr:MULTISPECIES: TIGR00341 family protein [Microbacterium]MDW4571353.1 TIGR00341 family protein [Microbacterium arthrosphaerae]MDW7605208.1 TIGR00341 family protein [Microbacterium sp. M3]